MADNSNQNDTTLSDVISDIKRHRRLAFLIILLVMAIYLFLWYYDTALPTVSQSWGTFGDFIGGILNPIFALFAFYWLTSSVRLQVKELQETKKELKKTAKAQAKSAKHQKSIAKLEKTNVDTQKDILELQKQSLQSQIDANAAQQQQIVIQNFESLFFELLKAKTDVTDNIVYHHEDLSGNVHANPPYPIIKTFTGKKAIEQCIFDFKNTVEEDWGNHYTDNLLGQLGSYFRLNYQILKLIHTNTFLQKLEKVEGKKYSAKQKEYFDIFRATFNQSELEAHFFNCLTPYGNGKFKNLIEDYGFFEPLLIDGNTSSLIQHHLTRYAYQYDISAFEDNSYWKKYFEEINKIKINLKYSELERVITDLKAIGFIRFSYAGLSSRNAAQLQNQTYFLKINDFMDKFDLERNLTTDFLRNIKRLDNSQWTEKLNFIKINILKISNYKKGINNIIDIFKKQNTEINEDEVLNYDDYKTKYSSIKSLKNLIEQHQVEIKSYKKDINDKNIVIKKLVNSSATLSALTLIKYGINYSEFNEFKKNKNNPN